MESTIRNKTINKIICLAAVFIMLFSLMSTTASFAADDDWDGTYYLSYKKYIEAEQPEQVTYTMITRQITNLLKEGMRRYEAGVEKDGDDGYYKPFTNSYGFWYETSGYEKTVMGYISGARVNEVELGFSNMKKAVNNNESVEVVQQRVDELEAMLWEDAAKLDEIFGYENEEEGSSSGGLAWATFIAVLTIIVREGLEAILIVGAMVAYLTKTNNKKGTKYVYIGAVVAVFASVLLAIILYKITSGTSNSIPQEIVEGVTALLAVVVLIYVSNWMLSKAESEAWTEYISKQVEDSADQGKLYALGFTSFLAVFREGAEVILFCQQYFARAGEMKNGYLAVFGGIVIGLIIVMAVFFAIKVFGVKLPLKPFFLATSILMAIMSISFLGAGMWELFMDGGLAEKLGGVFQQLAGTIPGLEWMNGNNILTFFGIYPTWITLGPQIILTIWTIWTYIKAGQQNKNKDKDNKNNKGSNESKDNKSDKKKAGSKAKAAEKKAVEQNTAEQNA